MNMNFNVKVKIEADDDVLDGDDAVNKENNEYLFKKQDMVTGLESFPKPMLTEISAKDANHDFNVEVKIENDYNLNEEHKPDDGNIKKKRGNTYKSGKWSCKLCPTVFSLKASYYRHMRVHDKGKQFACDMCDKKFIAKWNLTQHQRIHNNLKYTCHICGKCITDHSRFNKHVREHSGVVKKPEKAVAVTKLYCDICNKSYNARRNLVRHIQGHYEENRSRCPFCSKSYMRSDKLNKHMHNHHIVDKNGSRMVCNKKLIISLSVERRHAKKHS